MKARFAPVAESLAANEEKIASEMLAAQGSPVDIVVYYHPDEAKCAAAMRPSATLNGIIESLEGAAVSG